MSTLSDVYEIKSTLSQVECSFLDDDLDTFLCERVKDGYIVAWFHQFVLFGKVTSGNVSFHVNSPPSMERHLMEARIFNEQEEWHVWRDGRGSHQFRIRYRKDNSGTESWEFTETHLIMYGTKSRRLATNPQFTEIIEDRGIKYIIPTELLENKSITPTSRLVLVVRNYIKPSTLGQVSYVDHRFVKIKVEEF